MTHDNLFRLILLAILLAFLASISEIEFGLQRSPSPLKPKGQVRG